MGARHGKSQLGTIHFPAWYLGHNPAQQIITASHNTDLARAFGRQVRNLCANPLYQNIFEDIELAADGDTGILAVVGGGASSVVIEQNSIDGDNRTTRGLTPTEIGTRLLQRLTPALDEINAALNDLQEDPQNPVGSLRLHVPGVIARHILPPLLDNFLARYPGIALEVNMDNTFVDVIGAGYDAGIRYEESLANDMIAIPIGPRRQCFMAVAAPDYLQRHGIPQHPAELNDHRLLGYRFASGKLGVWEFEQDGRTLRIAPEGRLVSSSQDLLIAAACAGQCLKILEISSTFAREREALGQPITAYQAISHKLVDIQMMAEVARLVTFHAAEMLDAGQDAVLETTNAKVIASENNVACADLGMRVMGGTGYVEGEMQRLYRDARAHIIGGGTSDILRNVIAKRMGL